MLPNKNNNFVELPQKKELKTKYDSYCDNSNFIDKYLVNEDSKETLSFCFMKESSKSDGPLRIKEEPVEDSFLKRYDEPIVTDFVEEYSDYKMSFNYQVAKPFYADWATILLIFIGLMLFYIRYAGKNYILRILGAFMSYSSSEHLMKSYNVVNNYLNVILGVTAFVAVPLFVYTILDHFKQIESSNGLFMYALIFIAFLALYLLRLIGYKILGSIFDIKKASKLYLHNFFVYTVAIGVLTLPSTIGVTFIEPQYQNIAAYAGLAITIICYSLFCIRILEICARYKFSFFYIFLYFCTLEILPLLVVFRFVTNL